MLKSTFLGLLLLSPVFGDPHPFEWLAGTYADADTRETWTTGPNRQAFGLSQISSDGKAYLTERLHIHPEGDGYVLDLEMHFFDGRTKSSPSRAKRRANGECASWVPRRVSTTSRTNAGTYAWNSPRKPSWNLILLR
jgi:hypothetical protein